MFTIAVIVNGKQVDTVERTRLAEFTSLLSTYRNCGWTVNKHSAHSASAIRVV